MLGEALEHDDAPLSRTQHPEWVPQPLKLMRAILTMQIAARISTRLLCLMICHMRFMILPSPCDAGSLF